MRMWRRMKNDYLQRNGKERFRRYGVGDLIYRNKRKEIKTITYLLFTKSLPRIISDDVP